MTNPQHVSFIKTQNGVDFERFIFLNVSVINEAIDIAEKLLKVQPVGSTLNLILDIQPSTESGSDQSELKGFSACCTAKVPDSFFDTACKTGPLPQPHDGASALWYELQDGTLQVVSPYLDVNGKWQWPYATPHHEGRDLIEQMKPDTTGRWLVLTPSFPKIESQHLSNSPTNE